MAQNTGLSSTTVRIYYLARILIQLVVSRESLNRALLPQSSVARRISGATIRQEELMTLIQVSSSVLSPLLITGIPRILVKSSHPASTKDPLWEVISVFGCYRINSSMLSRSTRNAFARPRRAKSSSSIRPQPSRDQHAEMVDEKIAHYHAVAAAELAFQRAKESRLGIRTEREKESAGTAVNSDGNPALSRQKSIRFAGPSAVHTRSCSITRRNAPEYDAGFKERSSNTFSDGCSTDAEQSAARSLAIASTQGDEQFIEHDFASQPSSYRKLRKAKSMFTSGKAPSAVFPNGVPMAGRHFQRQSVRSSDSWGEPIRLPDPRVRKSFSFLRGVADRLPTNDHHYATHDDAIQLARDQYLRQLDQQRLKEQTSFFNLGKRRRSQKAFRRTVRTSSTNSYGNAIESPKPPVESLKPSGIGQKARSFSLNMKMRLKQAFRRSVSSEDSLPAQHLDASRAHYGDDPSTFEYPSQPYPSAPSPDAELLRRVESRESILRNSPIFVEQSSHSGSIRSVPSEDDLTMNKSRVTSWTNSTAANTIHMPPLVERKRLSVINEDGGPHQSSSSARQFDDLASGYAAFRQPFRQANAGGPPEPQRVFSALQREISTKSSEPNFDNIELGTESGLEQGRPKRTYNIIRGTSSGCVIRSELPNLPSAHLDYAEATEDLTPQQVAMFNESEASLSKRPLHELGSVFFHANSHIERKKDTSPYRRALDSTSEEEARPRSQIAVTCSSQGARTLQTTNIHHHSSSGARSESVYSRTSGGHTPKAAGSSVSLMKPEFSEELGTAVILGRETARYGVAARSMVPRRDFSDRSSKSSGEWKKKLASDLAHLGDHQSEDGSFCSMLPVKDSGHKRESAQLDGDDITVGRLHRTKHLPKEPMGFLQPTKNAHISLKQPASLERFPFLDVISSARPSAATHNEDSTFSQASLRAQHMSKPGSVRNAFSAQSSQVSLTVRNENVNSPASSHSRHSPERAERIRRLQSKSSFSLHKASSSPNLAAKGYLTENRAVFNTPPSDPRSRDYHPKENISRPNRTSSGTAGDKQFVERFLEGRRREMRISEESGGDPAFL